MTWIAAVLVGTLVLVAAVIWVLIPPFPPPRTLLNSSLPTLIQRLGTPREVVLPVPLRPAKLLEWAESRGVAFWTFQAVWQNPPADPTAHPDYVTRRLRLRGAPDWLNIILFLPCEAVFRARIL